MEIRARVVGSSPKTVEFGSPAVKFAGSALKDWVPAMEKQDPAMKENRSAVGSENGAVRGESRAVGSESRAIENKSFAVSDESGAMDLFYRPGRSANLPEVRLFSLVTGWKRQPISPTSTPVYGWGFSSWRGLWEP